MVELSGQTIAVRWDGSFCYIQLNRPETGNAITGQMLQEIDKVLDHCRETATVVILQAAGEAFSIGADFQALVADDVATRDLAEVKPELLYDVLFKLATGPFVSLADVRGKVNAGGVGLVAASDIVLAQDESQFSLSEMLFGLMPACVLPFLIRRTGVQAANYLTLMTHPIKASRAYELGLVDATAPEGGDLLRRHLLRLRRLSKIAIKRYKNYMSEMSPMDSLVRRQAIAANRLVSSDPENMGAISEYVRTGRFPWEK
jgi:polyketide biosynthesis enoyl-CoA hydratase PksH